MVAPKPLTPGECWNQIQGDNENAGRLNLRFKKIWMTYHEIMVRNDEADTRNLPLAGKIDH